MFIIDPRNKTAIFEQLKQQILEFISLNVLAPNDKLPSVRSLAVDLGINPNTVAKAYQELELQGYLYTVPGKGCFISDNNLDKQIQETKLLNFRETVIDLKKHNISQEMVQEVVNEVYKGGKGNAKDKRTNKKAG